ncbi:replication-relaxation family protein [Streptomyces sp. ALI-76-A]|uniref:replication-relaxation family protein n=1 Tax=Streptomyces sp. ALI-76-A TaxID=3025736 RepID=UPI003364E92B
MTCPGHKDNKAVRNACLDLARHGLAVSEGNSREGHKLWGLTPLGLDAVTEVLGRPGGGMGGIARGAARSGAPHAMAVNETVIALTRTAPKPTRPVHHTTPRARCCRRRRGRWWGSRPGWGRWRPGPPRWCTICRPEAAAAPPSRPTPSCTPRRRVCQCRTCLPRIRSGAGCRRRALP